MFRRSNALRHCAHAKLGHEPRGAATALNPLIGTISKIPTRVAGGTPHVGRAESVADSAAAGDRCGTSASAIFEIRLASSGFRPRSGSGPRRQQRLI